MQPNDSSPSPSSPPRPERTRADLTAGPTTPTALDLVRREARRLHRAATSGPLLDALPALRRLHAAAVLPSCPLMQLHRERGQLQRKHFLRTLAFEAGFDTWEAFRAQLPQMQPTDFDQYHLGRFGPGWASSPNHWFSTEAEAQAHASAHGGRVLRLGQQAVVVPSAPPESR